MSGRDEENRPRPEAPSASGSDPNDALNTRLAQLKETLQAARGAQEQAVTGHRKRDDGSGRAVATGMRAAADLVAGTLTGAAVGFYADRWLETRPVLLIVFLMVGIAAGFRNLYRLGMRPTVAPPGTNAAGMPAAGAGPDRAKPSARPDEGTD